MLGPRIYTCTFRLSLLGLGIWAIGCSKPTPFELADFRRNSLSIKSVRLQEKFFAKSSPKNFPSGELGTVFLYDMPRVVNPSQISCSLRDCSVLRIDCVNQERCYSNLGTGYAWRIQIRYPSEWPTVIPIQADKKSFQARIVDPDDPVIHLYAVDWRKVPTHTLEDSTNHLVWLIKRWTPTHLGPPVDGSGIVWESWIVQRRPYWAYIASREGTDDDQAQFEKTLRQQKAKPTAADIWELP